MKTTSNKSNSNKKKNNKRLTALLTIFFILAFLLVVEKLFPSISYTMGVSNYNKGNYSEAYNNFKIAVEANPKNRDYRYYLVESMTKLSPTLDIQKEMYDISQKNYADSADLIADRQIELWRNRISLNSGENFIEQAPFNDRILRWDTTKLPIKVYIKRSTSAAGYFTPQIQKAFLQWQASTENIVNFSFVNDEANANIVVEILARNGGQNCVDDNCKYTIAYTTPEVSGDRLKKMNMKFYATDNFGKAFSQREVYNTALHEAGHALGIMGHSYNKDDVMYMENNADKINDRFKSDFQLISPRDVNTLKLLYKLIPDVTNTDLEEFNTSHQIYAPILLGDDKTVNSRKLLEAENYVNAAPQLPNGYIDMAAAYAESKQYNNALQTLNKAFELCSNDDERYVVYYNMAVIYMQIEAWESAIKYAELAKQANPSADIDGMKAMFEYKLNYKDQAISDYNLAITRHPEDIINSINLATIYLKDFNLAKAGKVLNNFAKNNPSQANDPKLKRYGLLMFFFR